MNEQLVAKLAVDTDEFFDALEQAKAKLEQLIATKDKITGLLANVVVGISSEELSQVEVS